LVVITAPLGASPYLVKTVEPTLKNLVLTDITFLEVGLYPAVLTKPIADLAKSFIDLLFCKLLYLSPQQHNRTFDGTMLNS
jgi:hypothetical protein